MAANQHVRFTLADASYLSAVKRDIARLATKIGFSEVETGRINIVVSEMASNLVRHVVEGGELLVRLISGPQQTGIEIISLDRGPGMEEPNRMLEDGVSTYGSAGEGLGAIKRQSDFFDFYSDLASGSIILSRIYKTVGSQASKPVNQKVETGAIMVSKRKDDPCGDGWTCEEDANGVSILVLDGLGHGKAAHEASQLGIETFRKTQTHFLPEQLVELHNGIKATRGAVGAIARFDPGTEPFRFCGIGNITAKIFGFNDGGQYKVAKNLMSYNGTIGHIIPTSLQEQTADWQPGYLLLMHSDGLKSVFSLEKYPGIQQHHPVILAAALFRDFNRGTDDTLVMIAKAKN